MKYSHWKYKFGIKQYINMYFIKKYKKSKFRVSASPRPPLAMLLIGYFHFTIYEVAPVAGNSLNWLKTGLNIWQTFTTLLRGEGGRRKNFLRVCCMLMLLTFLIKIIHFLLNSKVFFICLYEFFIFLKNYFGNILFF